MKTKNKAVKNKKERNDIMLMPNENTLKRIFEEHHNFLIEYENAINFKSRIYVNENAFFVDDTCGEYLLVKENEKNTKNGEYLNDYRNGYINTEASLHELIIKTLNRYIPKITTNTVYTRDEEGQTATTILEADISALYLYKIGYEKIIDGTLIKTVYRISDEMPLIKTADIYSIVNNKEEIPVSHMTIEYGLKEPPAFAREMINKILI